MKPDQAMRGTGLYHKSRMVIRSIQHPAPVGDLTGQFCVLVPVLDWHDQTTALALLPELAKTGCQMAYLVGALAQGTYDQLDPVLAETASEMSMFPSETLEAGCQLVLVMGAPYPMILALCGEHPELAATLQRTAKSLGWKHA